jgi:hypothetical protein
VKKTRHVAIVIMVAAVVLAIGAAVAFAAAGAGDTTPPVTTSTVAASYAGDVSFQITSTDAVGVSYVYHRFDKGVARLYTVPTDTVYPSVTIDGPVPLDTPLSLGQHTLRFWGQDTSGNVESQNVVTVMVNPALTLARSASVVSAGKYFTLSGLLKPAAVGSIVIQAKKPGASAFKTLVTRTSNASGAYSYRYKTTTKGSWSFRTLFTDQKTALSATSPTVKVRIK